MLFQVPVMIGIIKLVSRDMNPNAIQERKPPQWVYDRLAATGGENKARYEASLYGPLNAFLTSYFGVDQNFMVKPQPKIRPEFIGNSEDVLFRPSLDSYHAEVLPRSFGGFEAQLRSPDFIVVKATASRDNDRLLLVVEIKPSDMFEENAVEQLSEYMGMLADKHRHDTKEPLFANTLHGLLILGDHVRILPLPLTSTMGPSGLLKCSHAAVHSVLRTIVQKNIK